jgi:hypothetical protein
MRAPREHDVFAALCGPDPVRFMRAAGIPAGVSANFSRGVAAAVADDFDEWYTSI